MKKVPEVRKVRLSAEEQLSMLLEKLAGHKVFGRCRGVFGDMPLDRLLKSGEPPSPSATLRAFERWASDQGVMLGMLAQFKRDGYDVAFEELRRALRERDRVITGETIPVEQTEPGVLVVPDPEITFLLARWMYTSQPEDGYDLVTGKKIPEERGQRGSLTGRLLEAVPQLRGRFSRDKNNHEESPTAIRSDKVSDLRTFLRDRFPPDNIQSIWLDPGRTGFWYFSAPVALFVKAQTQADVLRFFSREQQEGIGTWQFNYPKVHGRHLNAHSYSSLPNAWIGLHPELEHLKWQRQWPSYVSRGVAYGHGGVILLSKDDLGEGGGGRFPLSPYKVLRGPYPRSCTGNLMRRRFVLGFGSLQD